MSSQTKPATDFDPRHRIAGAIVLAMLVVIFVPMILGEPEQVAENAVREQSERHKESVTEDGLKRYVTRLPERDWTSPNQSSGTDTQRAGSQAGSNAASNEVQWEVWVAAFSKQELVDKLLGEMRELGYEAHSRKLSKGFVRVWVGPFDDEDTAKRMNEKINGQFKVKGIVAKH